MPWKKTRLGAKAAGDLVLGNCINLSKGALICGLQIIFEG